MNTMFVTVAAIGILAVVSPGPDFLVVTRNSLLYSKKVGLATALGIATGNILWIGASILGISYFIASVALLFTALKFLGASYLIYLGVQSLRVKRKPVAPRNTQEADQRDDKPGLTLSGAFRSGFITNATNPKCAMFFLSLFSVLITPKTPVILQWAYGLEIMVIAVTWFSLLATVLSMGKVKAVFDRWSLWVERVTGAILIVLGIKVAFYHQK